MNRFRATAGGLALGLAMTPLSACGGDSASASGGTLRYVTVGAPAAATHDPHGGIPNQSDLVRFALLYDVLAKPRADGTTELRLASSITPDEDLTTWTVKLRTDAAFGDGRPVRAADVLFSLRRIHAKSAENFGRFTMFDVAASKVVDGHTLELKTTAPYAEVPRALESITFVVPEGTTNFDKPPAGSGPYTMAGGSLQNAVLERKDGWWGGRPPTERIEVRAVIDPQARAQAVLSGQADVASSVSPATARRAQDGGAAKVVRRPGVVMYPFVMRLDREPFDDPRVREAVKLAADRKELLDKVFLGYGKVGNDLLTPADPTSPAGIPRRTRDVAKAKDLLREAGHGDGLDLTLATTTSYPGMDTAATLFARQLKPAGITVKVVNEPPDTYWTEVFAKRDFYTGYFGGIPFLDVARVSLLGDAPTNETAWKRPEWDEGFTEALATADAGRRKSALGELQREVRDEGGYVVWATGDGLDLTSSRVADLPTGPGFESSFIERTRLTS
ncbi:ABC transporter substrate-binding protein [Actinomadura sp. KC345]|uniref:ABC transporter substrate-binding protein n=1 Tax=Actinomadura sp. KC345 TaxID=2530371 RepID=UPI00104AB21B|nr:ABC transporter substrate-binding protein [Actinomadura sp. KC345]TDC56003.1 ABC transporter substrate-binding protein [Actinomadura sp. KC345]